MPGMRNQTVRNIRAVCIGIIVLLMASACNKPGETPATKPAAAASRPATMPASAVFNVNGVPITFESPRAAVDRHDGTSRLLIYSDKDNASGSFYFEVPIEGEWPGDGSWEWEMRVEQQERADTLVGIEAPQRTLQPVQLAVQARLDGAQLVNVTLHGKFKVYADDSDEPAGEAEVEAAFSAGLVDVRR